MQIEMKHKAVLESKDRNNEKTDFEVNTYLTEHLPAQEKYLHEALQKSDKVNKIFADLIKYFEQILSEQINGNFDFQNLRTIIWCAINNDHFCTEN